MLLSGPTLSFRTTRNQDRPSSIWTLRPRLFSTSDQVGPCSLCSHVLCFVALLCLSCSPLSASKNQSDILTVWVHRGRSVKAPHSTCTTNALFFSDPLRLLHGVEALTCCFSLSHLYFHLRSKVRLVCARHAVSVMLENLLLLLH